MSRGEAWRQQEGAYSVCLPTLPPPKAESTASAATRKVQHEPQALQTYRVMLCAGLCAPAAGPPLQPHVPRTKKLNGAHLQDGVCWLACDLPHGV